MKIVLTGGGTAGSVIPLLAIFQGFKKRHLEAEFLFIGTKVGPEEKIVSKHQLTYYAISSGKLRRYFSFKNLADHFKVLKGFFEARKKLKEFNPDLVISAGGFVGVPVIWAAYTLRIPSIIHQQDIRKGLANRLCQNFAKKITVAFEESLNDFPKNKTYFIGNPIRPELFEGSVKEANRIFGLKKDLPVLLVFGGGTGALNINKKIAEILSELVKFCQVIHLTGEGKQTTDFKHEHYHAYDIITHEMKDALLRADLVISRAGLSSLTELSVLKKPSIIIPIKNSHQDENARYFEKANAAILIRENIITPEFFLETIKNLLGNKRKLVELSDNIEKLSKPDALDRFIEIIMGFK